MNLVYMVISYMDMTKKVKSIQYMMKRLQKNILLMV